MMRKVLLFVFTAEYKEMSGMSRYVLTFGMPVCQLGRGLPPEHAVPALFRVAQLLSPPPPPSRSAKLSLVASLVMTVDVQLFAAMFPAVAVAAQPLFHVDSGMYEFADSVVPPGVAQYVVGLPP
jgi:hypothetical protein